MGIVGKQGGEASADGAVGVFEGAASEAQVLEAQAPARNGLEGTPLGEPVLEGQALEGRPLGETVREGAALEEKLVERAALEGMPPGEAAGQAPEGASLEVAEEAAVREFPQGWCTVCDRPLWSGAKFCGGCGRMVGREPGSSAGSSTMDDVRMLLGFFLSAMAIAVVWSVWFRVTENAFVVDLGTGFSLAALTVGYGLWHRGLLAAPLRTVGFSVAGYGLVLVASVPVLLLVSGYVDLLHGALGLHEESELAAFAGRSVLWPLLMVAVLPPLSEEVACRGILYGGLRRSLSAGEAMFLSSFAFAMLHLSVMSLFTHLPLGAYFCWLRQRSGSIWPGVFAHACHNLGVCLLTWW